MVNDSPIRWRWLGRIAVTALVAGGIAAVIAGVVAFAVSESLPKQYDSQAGLLVGSLTATSTDELDAYQRLAMTYAELATSSPVLTRVIDRLGLPDDPLQLADRVDVRATSQGIVLITTTASTPDEAAKISNAISDEIVTLAQPTTGTGTSLAAVFQPALPPTGPSSPRVGLNALIAALLGLALGGGFAVLIASRREAAAHGAG